uniref:Uncharacterized protein n=1 Tax=Cacopsylla melanoneura TaxID=428564 RepID=A0A8D8YDI6_9HEMI
MVDTDFVFEDLMKNSIEKTFLEVRFLDRTSLHVLLRGCSYSDYDDIGIRIEEDRTIVIFIFKSDGSNFRFPFAQNQEYVPEKNGHGHIDIDLTNNITIVDQVSFVTQGTPLSAMVSCNSFSIYHRRYNYTDGSTTKSEVSYKLTYQKEFTLVSPWVAIKHNQTLFILHSGPRGSNLSVLAEDVTIGNPVPVPCEKITQVNKTDNQEAVLTKVTVTFPQNWKGQKRIKITGDGGDIFVRNVWEGRPLDLYRVQEPQPCMKSNTSDIYNTFYIQK